MKAGRVLGTASVYGGSIGVVFVADILLSRSWSLEDFGEYSLLRTVLPLLSITALLGVDQALTRRFAEGASSSLTAKVLKRRLPLSVLVSTLAAAVMYWTLGTRAETALVVAGFGPMLMASDLLSAQIRGQGSYRLAVLVQQGYRLGYGSLVAAMLVAGIHPGLTSVAWALAGFIFVSLLVGLGSTRPEMCARGERVDYRETSHLGLAFGLSMIPFALMDWGDQALLGWLSGDLAVVGVYASSKLLAVYPVLSLASILGFMLMPEVIRRRSAITTGRLSKALAAVILLAAILGLFWVKLVPQLFDYLYDIDADRTTLRLLVVVGVLRLAYVVPSAVLGALGSRQLILTASAASLVTPIFGFLTAVVLWRHGEVGSAAAVAGGLLVGTLSRLAISFYAMYRAVEGRHA